MSSFTGNTQSGAWPIIMLGSSPGRHAWTFSGPPPIYLSVLSCAKLLYGKVEWEEPEPLLIRHPKDSLVPPPSLWPHAITYCPSLIRKSLPRDLIQKLTQSLGDLGEDWETRRGYTVLALAQPLALCSQMCPRK